MTFCAVDDSTHPCHYNTFGAQSQGCSEANHHQWMWLGAVSAAAAGLALQPGIAYCEADEQVSVAALVTVMLWQY